MAIAANHLVAIVQLIEEDEAEFEEIMLAMARFAAVQMAEVEEGVWLGDGMGGESLEPVTVFIDEYHMMSDRCFQMHFRMGRDVFEELSAAVHHYLTERGKLQRERTPFRDIMLMVLWIMATPDSFRSVALRFGVRPSTLHYFYSYIIEALRDMAGQYICWPNAEERNRIAETFQRATSFPGVIGSIDGTHVYITAPVGDAAPYRNRHDTYSLNVQAVVDSTLLVRDIYVGEVGSMHDARVFRRSPLHDDLLHGRDRLNADEHLVGDGAYVLTDFMMIPFRNNGRLNNDQLRFNRRLSQCRVRIENAFAMAKGKWRRLKFLHARNQHYVVDYITAAFVIHNFLILHGQPIFEEAELARRINDNEVFGDEPFAEVYGDEEEILLAAEERGAEKRNFIMDHLLH